MVLKFSAPVLYIAGAIAIWLDFLGTNSDGFLANAGLIVYTLPIVLIGSVLLKGDFPYVSGSYYVAHAIYFWSSVVLLALALFSLFHALQKIAQPTVPMDAPTTARH
jgi:hypothetical protein